MYHLVFPAKYRRAVFDDYVDSVLKEICLDIEKLYGGNILVNRFITGEAKTAAEQKAERSGAFWRPSAFAL
ncbi:hypothetical protein MNBD_GAMMA26-1170 [hydrothermal vent metagenome]|uniref:Transposase IS200-like domain-containing protein n=1 Tax=hydrothermal vent metagenome TaxID=652676 RepID=A0A3B1BYL4_9ZZZZ